MFTGIVQQTVRVDRFDISGGKIHIRLELRELAKEISIGDSVMVAGVCLTAASVDGESASFDVVRETKDRTRLPELHVGDNVNIELALRLNDRLGGHLVSGHVDGIGRIQSIRKSTGEVRMAIDAPKEVRKFLIEKGSVAVDGISLTVAALTKTGFEVALIPHTIASTTLKNAKIGDRVNLEGDMIGRWVARFLEGGAGKNQQNLTEKLRKSGFFD